MSTSAPQRVDAATLRDWLNQPQKATVIDVRSPAEYETARVSGSVNVPLNLIEGHAAQVAARLDRDVVLICQSGNRAEQARKRLAGAGAERLHVFDGGVEKYADAGGQVIRGRARWALERQVRLVAGSLVLAGVIAGMRYPKARLLPAAVGAGLTISALTDTCTMGRLLAALPYNRGSGDPDTDTVLDQLTPGDR